VNVLSAEKRQAVIHLLVEGNSIRSIERLTGVHRDTIMRLLVKVGNGCREFLDERMRGLRLHHLQLDEIWTFVLIKQGNLPPNNANPTIGDQFLYIALDEKTKLIPTFALGKRNSEVTNAFALDLAGRIVTERPMISSDGWQAYPGAIRSAFGEENVNYGQIIKDFAEPIQPGRYGPPLMVASERRQILGLDNINPFDICTSHVERNNLNIRTFMKRFTRLSLGFSKKLENLAAAVALHVAYHNFCRVHRTLRMTPAMAANVADHVWTLVELLESIG
jgi:IS1 family transposase